MNIFVPQAADILQHVAVILEATALVLISSELRLHRQDQSIAGRASLVTMGLGATRIPDRSNRIRWGIGVALLAFSMEIYQLLTLYLA